SHTGQVLRYNANGTFDAVFTKPSNSLLFQFPSDALFISGGHLVTANLGPTYPASFGGPGTSGSLFEFGADGAFSRNLGGTSFPAAQGSGVTNFSPSQLAQNLGNKAPTVNAGTAYTLNEGSDLTLSASASTDPDGDTLTYSWDIN